MKLGDGNWWMLLIISASILVFGVMVMNGGYVSYKYQMRIDFGGFNFLVGLIHISVASFFIYRLLDSNKRNY